MMDSLDVNATCIQITRGISVYDKIIQIGYTQSTKVTMHNSVYRSYQAQLM